MPTAKSLVKHYVMHEQQSTHHDEQHKAEYTLASFILGILHVFCGLFSIALGIGSICTHASGYFIAYGIWCGFIFILAGVWSVVICVPKNSTACLIMFSMVFAVFAACAALVQFSLGIVAASNDRGNTQVGRLNAYLTTSIPRYDIYYSKQWDAALCKGSDGGFTWTMSWGPVDVLLLIVAFIELIVAIATAVIGVKSACCGHVRPVNQGSEMSTTRGLQTAAGPPGGNGYYNEGYGDHMQPPLYTR